MRVNLVQLALQSMSIGSTTGATWYLLSYPMLSVEFTGVGSWTLTLSLESGWAGGVDYYGMGIEVMVRQNATGTSNITWGSNFSFSGSDYTITQGAVATTRYTGIYAGYGGTDKFYMTKTAY